MTKIHLIGICGTGMGSFAGLLKAAGHDVRGSDENVYPPMSDKLAAWGIPVAIGYRAENLEPPPELVVVGNVIKRTNVEAQAVVERGLAYTSFPKALGDLFLAGRHGVVVAGTHGKTTTTSLVAWLLTSAGRDPGLLVGGVPANFGEGFRLGHGEHFVVEGDEYDTAYFDKVPKFLHYHPKSLIVTSIEFDHADIYADVEAIEREFDKLVALVPPSGRVFACASSTRVLARIAGSKAPVETYTAREGVAADWWVRDVEMGPSGTAFTVMRANMRLGHFHLPMTGRHNVENAVGAIAFACSAGLSVHELDAGLRAFEGVARRQTVRAEIGGIRVIDDFAHHPTAVVETIAAIRARYPSGRLFAIFEPRTATSARKYFQDLYVEAFDAADETIIAGVGRKELAQAERLDTEQLAKDIAARGKRARNVAEIDAIVKLLTDEAERGDTLLFMSNGGFGGIYGKIEAALRARHGGA
ncbi:UDP-N-acetylmuramate:L-alanyl-gamma-D-glutamyl-meso-diaminopimelate ligase [Myxococcota bacterium]|nr:UDP-N-acetylmuramate:L-alanyl-gamma-D-glutamyl-meso-diaminopimelate ligase [Myxococcota bacterium]